MAAGPGGDAYHRPIASDRTPPIRLFLADVDGTLVTQDKVLTDDAVAAVQSLRRAGVLFALTSGRPPQAAWRCWWSPCRSTRPSPPSTAA